MATQKEDVQINLKIHGIEEFKSLKDLNAQLIAQRRSVEKMDKSDPGYAEAAARLRDLIRIQKEWKDEILKTKKANKENNDETKSAWAQIKSMAAGVSLGNMLSDGLSRAKDFVLDIIKNSITAAAEAEGVLRAFARLNNPNLLAELRQATLGTVSDLDLMKAAVNFNNFQLPVDKLGTALKFAHERARDTGQSVDYLVESMVTGIARKSPLILDNLGINIQRVNAEFQKSGDFAAAAFKIIQEELDKTAGNAETGADRLERNSARLKNITVNLGLQLAVVTNAVNDNLGKMLQWLERVTAVGTEADKLAKSFREQTIEVRNLEKNIIPLADRYDVLQSKAKRNKEEQQELNKIIDQIRKIMPDAANKWSKLGDVIGVSTQKIRDNIKEMKAANAILNKEAIKETEIQIKSHERMVQMYKRQLEQGTKVKTDARGMFTELVPLTKEDRIKLDRQLEEAKQGVLGYNKILKDLTGDFQEPPPPPEDKSLANSIANRKAQLESAIEALKLQYDALAETDMTGRTRILKEIANNEAKLAALYGKTTPAQNEAANKAKQEAAKALAEFNKMNDEFKKLNVAKLNDDLSQSEKEVELSNQKYDSLITKEKEFLKMKGATADQIKAIEIQISALEAEKITARTNIRIRQESEMLDKITQLRNSLSLTHATELEKQKETINKFYDELEKENLGNEEALYLIRKKRAIELTDAEIREKVRLEDEKKRIEAEGEVFQDLKKDQRIAKINKQYDDEIEALKKKFSKEQQLTVEFQATIDAINANRAKATAQVEQEATSTKLDYATQAAETLANTVYTIGANNRRRETDLNLSNIERLRNKELENKNLTEEQKKQINAKYDQQAKAEKLRAWRADQSASATQAIIAGLLGAAKAMPNLWLAGIAAGTGIANAVAIRAEKPPVFRKGVGLVPDGPSHEQGGINLINNSTGDIIGEMEGGEPIMILSRETRRNNGRLINELLYNSQYRNGAPVSLNTELAAKAMASYRTGGIAIQEASQPTFNTTNVSVDTSTMEAQMAELIELFKGGLPFDYRADIDFREKMDKIKARVNS